MADEPSRAPWLDAIKRTRQLTIGLDGSLAKAGWDRVFRDAITEFNKLSATHRLGVTFAQAQDLKAANVEARAVRGDFEFEYPPRIAKKTIQFDGAGIHGLCKPMLTLVREGAQPQQFKLERAFIYVPAAPLTDRNGKSRVVGDPIKLVIAVHEMIHACGIVDNDEHSADDVFAWPALRVGTQASDDRFAVVGDKITIPTPPGVPPRTGYSKIEMPPVFLKNDTAAKVRALWS